MHEQIVDVIGGVDTHGDVHVAAALDGVGRVLGTASFPTDAAGYRALLGWLRSHGRVVCVGVEGTGSYGAGLARHLAEVVEVVEVNRPDRQTRRRRGKSDTTDAVAAARAVLSGDAAATPKAGNGAVEAIRALHVVRRSALKARTQASNQLRDLLVTAPEALRSQLRGLDTEDLVGRCANLRPGNDLTSPTDALKKSLRHLARRHHALDAEIDQLDTAIAELAATANPALIAARGVGPDVAAALLVAAGDNPHRMSSEAGFAALCGVSPIEASSGKTTRHRLNRGGNRQANSALWRVVMVRLSCDQRTQAYAARRHSEGRSDREIIRCLKRAVARELFRLIVDPPVVPHGADLRAVRTAAGITLATVADQLGTWPTRISELERGLKHDADLATRYQTWLQRTT